MGYSRALIDIPVPRATDIDAALRSLAEEAEQLAVDERWSSTVTSAPEILGVQGLTHEAVTLRAMLTTQPGQQHAVARELRTRVAARLARDALK